MKTFTLLLIVLALSGCSSLPKDSYIRHAEIVTPWGTTKVEGVATGAAARNLTAEERREMLAPKTK